MITVKCPLYIKPGKDSLRDFFIPNKSDKNGEPIFPKEPRILHFCLVVITISVAVVAAIFPQDAIVIINIVGSTVFLLVRKTRKNKGLILIGLLHLSMYVLPQVIPKKRYNGKNKKDYQLDYPNWTTGFWNMEYI
jgi:hypothetical protein